MKKVSFPYIALLGILVLLSNCEKENFHNQQQDRKERVVKRLKANDIPEIIDFIHSKTGNAFVDVEKTATYGSLDLGDILQVIDTIGNTNYSFNIVNVVDNGLSIYNLIVHTDENGTSTPPYIIAYKMTEDFAQSYYSGEKTFQDFTGNIIKYKIANFLRSHQTNKGVGEEDGCPCSVTPVDNGSSNTGSGSGTNNDGSGGPTGGGGGGGSGGDISCHYEFITIQNPCDGGGDLGSVWYSDHDPTEIYEGGPTCSGSSGPVVLTVEVCTDNNNKSNSKVQEICTDNTGCPDSDGEVGVNIDVIFEDQVFVDNSFKNNPCLKSIYDGMGKASAFQNYLKNFEPEFSVAHLRFEYDEGFKTSHSSEYWNSLAVTESPRNFNIRIIFNGDTQLEASIHNKPRLLIAVSFIHEIIHAEIFRKLLSAAQRGNLDTENMTQQEQVDFVNNLRNNFPGIYDYFLARYKPNAGHEQMAEHYRNVIISAIKQYDNNQHSQEVYNALAWVGLEGTIAWNNLTQSERDNITQLKASYVQNNSDTCD